MKRILLSLFLLLPPLIAAADSYPDIVISGLSIIDVESGRVSDDRTLTIRDGIIHSVGDSADGDSSLDADVVYYDFSGRFAIPGLWDMHVHLRGGEDLAEDNRLWLRQYLGYGVTSIRGAGGDIPVDVLSWKEAIANQTQVGPRIFASLRKVDRSPTFRPGSVEISSVEEIPAALQGLEGMGADFVKINDGLFPDSTFLEVLRQAERLGLPTAAHIPVGISVLDLAEAGLGSVEHSFFLTRFASTDEEQLVSEFKEEQPDGDPFADYFGMYNAFAATTDDQKARRIFRVMADNGVAVTPTIYLTKRWFSVDESTSPDSDSGYFETPASILRTHDVPGWIEYMNERPPERVAADLKMVSEAQRLVGLAAAQGVTILAGSDTGTTNTFMYPGDSLHHELAELVAAGLSPQEALAAATVNAAEWFGLGDKAGSIDPGKWADILILDANALKDMRNSRAIFAVLQFGVLHDRADLERLKKLPDESRQVGLETAP